MQHSRTASAQESLPGDLLKTEPHARELSIRLVGPAATAGSWVAAWSELRAASAACFTYPESVSSSAASNVLLTEIRRELQEVKSLLKQHIAAHEGTTHMAAEPRTVELRDVGDAEAKAEILNFFAARRGQDVYYEDLCETLALPIEQVSAICSQLEEEGIIGTRE